MSDQRPPDEPSDAALEAALRGLGDALDWPAARPAPGAPDVAARVRARIVARSPHGTSGRGGSWWPARRALVMALLALAVLAGLAAAVAFGVPGIRLVFGEPSAAPPATLSPRVTPGGPAGPPGAGLGLGRITPLGDVGPLVTFPVRLPAHPSTPAPDATWVSTRGEVTLVWAPSAALPPTADGGVGLLLTEFRGSVAPGTITKSVDAGTVVQPVTVAGARGFWISGEPHVLSYETPDGEIVADTRRWVGDVLIWAEGDVTYRLETSLGRDAAVRIAESLR